MAIEDYESALEAYYELKSEYDANKQSQINRIVRNPALDRATKRKRLSVLNTKCIVCGKSGGTRFYQEDGILIARCGNATQPCGLDIRLKRAKARPCYEVAAESFEDVEKPKREIIALKMDILFGYIDEMEAVTSFGEAREKLQEEEKVFLASSEEYMKLVSDVDRERELSIDEKSLYVAVQNLRNNVKEYKESGDPALINAILTDYSDVIRPLAGKIRGLKYRYSGIEKDMQAGTFKLVEDEFTPTDAEFIRPEDKGEVLAFVTGKNEPRR